MKIVILTFLVTFVAANANELPCNCRLNNLNRIVNGQVAAKNSIPWIVSLSDTGSNHFCGGTILNENFILTAAHCTEGKSERDILVRVGLHETKDVDLSKIYFSKRIIQGKFQNPGDFGDFALIELRRPITFKPEEIEPACLNLEKTDFEEDLLSAGWGLTQKPWKELGENEINEPYEPNSILKYFFGTQTSLGCENHDICVVPKNEGDSACNGDSGGPLMYTKNGKTSVVGIASFVSGTFENGKIYFCNGKSSFARVLLYKNLIDEHVEKYCTF